MSESNAIQILETRIKFINQEILILQKKKAEFQHTITKLKNQIPEFEVSDPDPQWFPGWIKMTPTQKTAYLDNELDQIKGKLK